MMLKKQSGAVLIISLIILVALTVFVLSASQSVLIQEKMTSAVRDMHLSLEITESGVKDAEAYIEGLSNTSTFSDTGTDGLYSQGTGPVDLFADATWTDDVIRRAVTDVSDNNIVASYFIEDMGEITFGNDDSSSLAISTYGDISESRAAGVFKVVSRSLGRNGNTERIIISYYAKSF